MKRIQILLIGLSVLFAYSCSKDEIDTYSAEDSIYFSPAVYSLLTNGPKVDSMYVTFAFDKPEVTEKTVKIPVRVQGSVVDYDRTYKVELTSQTTATEDVHFQQVITEQVFHAGLEVDTLSIDLMRQEELKDTTLVVQFKLLPNEHFNTEMEDKVINEITGKILSYTTFNLHFDDILSQPKYWYDYYLGPFSRKKLLIVVEGINEPMTFFSGPAGPPMNKFMFAGKYLKKYLADMEAAGTPVYEEDGTPMIGGR